MTWIKFTLWLLAIYSIYYAALLTWDFLRGKRGITTNGQDELTFVEHIEPVQSHADLVDHHDQASSVVHSGGVRLKELFNLCREESVEYIKAVSF